MAVWHMFTAHAVARRALHCLYATVFLVVGIQPAQAMFGDCSDLGYLGQFDSRLHDLPFDCVEVARVTVATRDGPRDIRLVHDLHGDWATSPQVIEDFVRGIQAVPAAAAQLGSFSMYPVTVLLVDQFSPPADSGEGFSDIAGVSGVHNDECLIGLYLLSAGATVTNAAHALVHEIFHCIQFASLDSEVVFGTSGGGSGTGGDWWIEGSAEWFTALTLPDAGLLASRLARFDRRSPDTPLYGMAYEAVVFFLWLGASQGPEAILPFLGRMASSPSTDAQRAAMAAAIDDVAWLRFAQDYLDEAIVHPHGTELVWSLADGEQWRFADTRTESIRLAPFVLTRGWIEYECGDWENVASPEKYHAVRSEAGAGWDALPVNLVSRNGHAQRFRLGAMAGATRPATLALTVTLQAGCTPCEGSVRIDACLVGAWEETGGGQLPWVHRNVFPDSQMLNPREEGGIVLMQSDGRYFTAPRTAKATVHTWIGRYHSQGDGSAMFQASGRWSVGDGKLNMCQDAGQASAHLMIKGQKIPLPPQPSVGSVQLDYSCSGQQLETRIAIPGVVEPMVTRYTRVADTPD